MQHCPSGSISTKTVLGAITIYKHSRIILGSQQLETEQLATYAPCPPLL